MKAVAIIRRRISTPSLLNHLLPINASTSGAAAGARSGARSGTGTSSGSRTSGTGTGGIIRAVISNVSMPGQSIVLKALQSPDFRKQQAEKVEILRKRAAVTAIECRKSEYADCWDVYPFNSGYFMCLKVKGVPAETVRQKLLEAHGVGAIALGQTELRVAFSCLTEAQIPGVFSAAAAAVF